MDSLAIPLDELILNSQQVATRTVSVAKKRIGRFAMAWELWSIYRSLRSVLKAQREIEVQASTFDEKELAPLTDRFIKLIATEEQLYDALQSLISCLGDSPHSNWSVVGAALDALKSIGERLLDYTVMWQSSFDPTMRARIATAQQEFEHGETVTLDKLGW